MDSIYRELILDLNKNPKNFKAIDSVEPVDGVNPLCGDEIKLYLKVKDDIIEDASFLGKGCAISTASASLMTESIKGMKVEDALNLKEEFVQFIRGEGDIKGKLQAFSGIKNQPSRAKCATLAWHTLDEALKKS